MWQVAFAGFLIATLAAFAQAVSGFGSALVAAPLLAMVTGPRTAVIVVTTLGLVMSGMATARERRHVEWRLVGTLTVTGLIGMPLGLVLLTTLNTRVLTFTIAILVLLASLLLMTGWSVHPGPWLRCTAGVVSGAMLTSTGMNGPPLVLTMQAMRLSPATFRANLQAAFFAQDIVAIASFVFVGGIDHAALVTIAAGLAGLPIGWSLGDLLFRAFHKDVFHRIVIGMLVVSAVVAAGTALAG